jgi:hypothetical protein
MIEASAPSTGGYVACSYGVPAPPGVVMVAPLEVSRNASRAQCEGRTKEAPQRGQENYKGRGPEGHRPYSPTS